MQISLPTEAYARPGYDLAETRLLNYYTEPTPAGPTPSARLPRPGLSLAYTVGSGPIWGLFREAGVFSGDRFALSGNNVYREAALIGSVSASRAARWAASSTQLVLVTGGKAYCYDGTTFSQISDPDLPAVSDVVYLASRFYYLQQNSDRWYFSALGDATSIDGLAFATNDEKPDANVGGAVLSDQVYFFGGETVEPWYQTGDATNPLQRSQGRTYSSGCPAQLSIVALDNALFFVDSERRVCRTGSVPTRVSNYGIEERLRTCTAIADVTALPASVDGHKFYVLNIPGEGSFACDISQGNQWSEWSSFGQTIFNARVAIESQGVVYLGDATSGAIWQLDPTAYTDGGTNIERVVSCTALAGSGAVRCDRITLQSTLGNGLADGTVPLVQMRFSDDGGRTWSDWDARSLGAIGDYTDRPTWSKLGVIRAPGRTFEFRTTDPINCVVSGVVMNEPRS